MQECVVATETGKRYFCEKCGCEFVVTRGSSDGTLKCCDTLMEKK